MFKKSGTPKSRQTFLILLAFLLLLALLIPMITLYNKKTVDTTNYAAENKLSSRSEGSVEYASNSLLIKLKKEAKQKAKEGNPADTGINSLNETFTKNKVKKFDRVAKTGKKSDTNTELFGWYQITTDTAETTVKDTSKPGQTVGYKPLRRLMEELKKDSAVEVVEPVYMYHTSAVPNDPYYRSAGSWGQPFDDMWNMKIMHADSAWDQTTGSGSIIVADIDTGVDRNHEDLQANMWVNTAETPNNGIDDDNNGYVDDYYGWNYVGNNNNPLDDHGHGTHTSGTIAAVGNNGLGVAGVNWTVKIMALKFLNSSGGGSNADGIRALQYAADMGARVSSNSWGCGCFDPAMADAIQYEHDRNMITVTAAGNNNMDTLEFSPASSDYAVAVAASDHNDAKASFSDWGERLDVSAPGVDILSLRATGTDMYGDGAHFIPQGDTTAKYYRASGTSMATPHVSGLAALILARNPNLTNEEVRQIIRQGADDLGTSGKDSSFGYGRINAGNSIPLAANHILAPVINSPRSRTTIFGTSIQFIGGVPGPDFASYKLEVGIGRAPLSWTMIMSSTTQITNGVLATVDTTQLPEGKNIFRLTAIDTAGKQYQYEIYDVEIDNFDASITIPSQFAPVGHLNIYGSAATKNGLGFTDYSLDWGEGTNPQTWNTTGITVTNNGSQPVQNGQLGTWDTSSLTDGQVYTLRLTVRSVNGRVTQFTENVKMDRDLVNGWPKPLQTSGGFEEVSPGFADIAGDSAKELIVLDPGIAKVHAYAKNGVEIPGFPVSIQSGDYFEQSTVVTDDLDGDGKSEIIAGSTFNTSMNRIYVIRGNGTLYPGWPLPATHMLSLWDHTPTVADIDEDGTKEIVTYEYDSDYSVKFHAYHLNGTEVAGFPKVVPLTSPINNSSPTVTVADINHDGHLEMAFGNSNSLLLLDRQGNVLPGWPVNIPLYNGSKYVFNSAAAVGNTQGNNQLQLFAVATQHFCNGCIGRLYGFNYDGTGVNGFPIDTAGMYDDGGNTTHATPSMVDVNNDGKDEIVLMDRNMQVFSGNGALLVNTPLTQGADYNPATSDVDGDGKMEFTAVTNTRVRILNDDGTYFRDKGDFAEGNNYNWFYSPLVFGDMDNNGMMEMAAIQLPAYPASYSDQGSVYVWEFTPNSNNANYEWPMVLHDSNHTGRLSASIPVPTISSQPTSTPIPTLRPTNTPPPTPTPTRTPTPTPTPIRYPRVTINQPVNGAVLPTSGSFTISATANDPVGVKAIQLYIDNTQVKTCSSTKSVTQILCSFSQRASKVISGTHTITAIGFNKNSGTNSITISVTKP